MNLCFFWARATWARSCNQPEIGAPPFIDQSGLCVAPVAACRGSDVVTLMLRNHVPNFATLETPLLEEANICVKREGFSSTSSLTSWPRQCWRSSGSEIGGSQGVWFLRLGSSPVIVSSSAKLLASSSVQPATSGTRSPRWQGRNAMTQVLTTGDNRHVRIEHGTKLAEIIDSASQRRRWPQASVTCRSQHFTSHVFFVHGRNRGVSRRHVDGTKNSIAGKVYSVVESALVPPD